jgi:DHA1 family quinolone resistance protein-like MFS transporter
LLKSLKRLHWSIYSLAFCSAVLTAGFLMLMPVLPAYADQLGFNEYQIGLLVGMFTFGLLLQFPFGVLSDHIGRKAVMGGGILLFTATTLSYAITTDFTPMLVSRLLQGVASGAFYISYESYINDRTSPEQRGLANGINSGAVNAGIILGPIIGGFLSGSINLQAPFYVSAALGISCFIVVLFIPHVEAHQKIRSWNELLPGMEMMRRVFRPIFTPGTISLALIHFLQLVAGGMFIVAAPLVMSDFLSWSGSDIALALALNGVAAVVVSPFVGKLADFPGRRLTIMGAGLAAVAFQNLMIYLHLGAEAAVGAVPLYASILLLLGLLVGGAGNPTYYSSFYSLIGDTTLIRERGSVGGFIGSFGVLGSFLGASFLAPFLWNGHDSATPMGAGFLLMVSAILINFAAGPLIRRQMKRVKALSRAEA